MRPGGVQGLRARDTGSFFVSLDAETWLRFQREETHTQKEWRIMGKAPGSLGSSRVSDGDLCNEYHTIEVTCAEQACIQAALNDAPTLIALFDD